MENVYHLQHIPDDMQIRTPQSTCQITLTHVLSVATQISGCVMEVPIHSCMCNRSLSSLHKVSTTRALITIFSFFMKIVLSKHPIGLPLLPTCAFVHILTLGSAHGESVWLCARAEDWAFT